MEASEVIKQQKTEIYNLKAKIKKLENKAAKSIAGDKALKNLLSAKKALASFTSQSGKEDKKAGNLSKAFTELRELGSGWDDVICVCRELERGNAQLYVRNLIT